jgi:selenocysteine lyase/cysteine desulfurase
VPARGDAQARFRDLREHFPVLEQAVYLNSCSTGAYPAGMRAVLAAHWETLRAWRDDVWERWLADLSHFHRTLAAFLGAPVGSVLTDTNASVLLSRVLGSLDFGGERRRLVVSSLDFPTVEWIARALARRGAEVVVVPATSDGRAVDEERLHAAITEQTLAVCVSHVTFSTSSMLDVPALVRRAREQGALVALDGYQSVGVLPVDVTELGVDLLVGGGKKWLCGAPDLGFLYVKPALTDRLEPVHTGWFAGEAPLRFERVERFAPDARRFGSGTPAILPAQLSQVGLDLVASAGLHAIRAASLALTGRLLAWAREHGVRSLTPEEPHRRGGAITLAFDGSDAAARELLARRFVVSHRGGLRISPHFYNTEDEIAAFLDALTDVVRSPRK